ncbi:MAG: hypothetical protein ACXADD_20075, partial [Candidatus Thorarchaeota archaeon]
MDSKADYNETHPLDPDSDNDRLLDGIERIQYVLWWEAENYTKIEATQKVEDSVKRASRNYAATSTLSNEIFVEITQNLPSSSLTYVLYVKARKSAGSNGSIEIRKDGSPLETVNVDNVEYQWYSTKKFSTSSSIKIELNNTTSPSNAVYVDKVMLVNISTLSVYKVAEDTTPATSYEIEFRADENRTVHIDIPIIGTVPMYVVNATITLEGDARNGNYPLDPYMNLGDNTNFTLHQWGWLGLFDITAGEKTTLDLAGEINMYIAKHIHDGPLAVND